MSVTIRTLRVYLNLLFPAAGWFGVPPLGGLRLGTAVDRIIAELRASFRARRSELRVKRRAEDCPSYLDVSLSSTADMVQRWQFR